LCNSHSYTSGCYLIRPIIIFPYRAQNPATANDHHTIATVIKLIHKYYVSNKAQSPITSENDVKRINQHCLTSRMNVPVLRHVPRSGIFHLTKRNIINAWDMRHKYGFKTGFLIAMMFLVVHADGQSLNCGHQQANCLCPR
jgi:hypothetical protein